MIVQVNCIWWADIGYTVSLGKPTDYTVSRELIMILLYLVGRQWLYCIEWADKGNTVFGNPNMVTFEI